MRDWLRILATLIEIFGFARREIKHGLVRFGEKFFSGSTGGNEIYEQTRPAWLVHSESALVQAETFAKSKTANVTLARVDQNVNVSSQQLKHMELARQQTTETMTDKNQADRSQSQFRRICSRRWIVPVFLILVIGFGKKTNSSVRLIGITLFS